MSQKSIVEIAEGFGLSVEAMLIPDHENAFRIYKGVNPLFIGTEDAVRNFLIAYEEERHGMKRGATYGYKGYKE